MTFALPRGWYEPPDDEDDSAWRYVNCPECGVIAHQPIPDDQNHCPCWRWWDDEFGEGYRDDCPCPCHGGDE